MATQIVELSSDEARLLKGLQRVIDREEQHKRKLEATGAAGERTGDRISKGLTAAGKASDRAGKEIFKNIDTSAKKSGRSFEKFGSQAKASIIGMAGAYVSVQGALQKVLELNQKVLDTNREALGALQGTEGGDRRLLQVSGSKGEFEQLRGTADRLSSTYGIDRVESRELVFSAKSEGFQDALTFIARNAQVIDPRAQATVAGQVPGLFKGEKISPQQAVNATLAAATESRLSFEDIARALPGAAEGGALAGADATETVATLSVLAGRFKSAETAADRIKAFTSRVGLDKGTADRESLAGSGILKAVERINALPEGQRNDFLGNSQEVNAAFKILNQELQTIRDRVGVVRSAIDTTGTDQSITAQRVRIADADPELRALKQERLARLSLEVARDDRAVSEAKRQSRVSGELSTSERTSVSPLRIAAAEDIAAKAAGFGLPTDRIVGLATGDQLSNLSRDLGVATRTGYFDQAGPGLLATEKLIRARSKDPNALLSSDATAEFVRGVTGRKDLFGSDITETQRRAVTEAIERAAQKSRGLDRSASVSLLNFLGGESVPGIAQLYGVAGREGAGLADDIVREAMHRQNELLAENNRLQQQIVDANKQTANNTSPSTPSYGNLQRAGR